MSFFLIHINMISSMRINLMNKIPCQRNFLTKLFLLLLQRKDQILSFHERWNLVIVFCTVDMVESAQIHNKKSVKLFSFTILLWPTSNNEEFQVVLIRLLIMKGVSEMFYYISHQRKWYLHFARLENHIHDEFQITKCKLEKNMIR